MLKKYLKHKILYQFQADALCIVLKIKKYIKTQEMQQISFYIAQALTH